MMCNDLEVDFLWERLSVENDCGRNVSPHFKLLLERDPSALGSIAVDEVDRNQAIDSGNITENSALTNLRL